MRVGGIRGHQLAGIRSDSPEGELVDNGILTYLSYSISQFAGFRQGVGHIQKHRSDGEKIGGTVPVNGLYWFAAYAHIALRCWHLGLAHQW